ncbi:MAG: hypothetical protein U5K51_16905 [Flavobacteriaceae bacterium]|nr:hypothetical protein [Flavobacteriaceae bacterium]
MRTDFEIKEPRLIDVKELIRKYNYEDEISASIETENLLPGGNPAPVARMLSAAFRFK